MAAVIALALSLGTGSAPPLAPASGWAQTGRLIDRPDLHLGVRPAAYVSQDEIDVGVTVQVSLNVL